MRRLFLLLLLAAGIASAATCTLQGGAGAYNLSTASAANWSCGHKPVDGDVIRVPNSYTLQIDENLTIGDSASPAAAALGCSTGGASGTAVINVSPGATLTLHAKVVQCNATWTVGSLIGGGADVYLEHASTRLGWETNSSSSSPNAKLQIYGTAGRRSNYAKSASGSVPGGAIGNGGTAWSGIGSVDAQYVNFNTIGDNSSGSTGNMLNGVGNTTYYTLTLKHVTVTNCGKIIVANLDAAATVDIDHFRVSAPNLQTDAPSHVVFQFGASVTPTGTRSITNAYFEGGGIYTNFTGGSSPNFTVSNVVFNATAAYAWSPIVGNTGNFGTVSDVLIISNNQNTATFGGVTINRMLYLSSLINNHPLQGFSEASTVDGMYVESNVDDNGTTDVIQQGSSATTTSVEVHVKHVVLAPNSVNGSIGPIANYTATSDARYGVRTYVEHCTWLGNGTVSGSTMGAAGEINHGGASPGLYQSVQSNLVYRLTSGTGWVEHWDSGGIPLNAGTYQTADYNGTFNLTNNPYYQGATSAYASTPGTHDVSVSGLNFVDPTRRFLTWGKRFNGAYSAWSDVVADMAKLADDSGFNPAMTINNAYTFLMAGWAPTTTALKGTAHDGGDIGALPVALDASQWPSVLGAWKGVIIQ